jgi:hypothetical protein
MLAATCVVTTSDAPAELHRLPVLLLSPCQLPVQLSARAERLRHPSGVTGLQWSPGGALGHASPQVSTTVMP